MQKLTPAEQEAVTIIDTWMDYQTSAKRIPGASVGVIRGDKILFAKGYGYADIKKKKRATARTTYRIASITKMFTAIAIMQLVEQGKIRLGDKISKHLHWCKEKKSSSLNRITIRQLLQHCSGIKRDGDTPHWGTNKFPTAEEIAKCVAQNPMIFRPGQRFKYSNFGYALLGQLITEVTGHSYERYISKHIIKPLGLQDTKTFSKTVAQGYARDHPGRKRESFSNPHTKAMTPAGGLSSSVLDCCHFLAAQYTQKRSILSQKSFTTMRKQEIKTKDDKDTYGLGYVIWHTPEGKIFGHSGGFKGFITSIGMNPQQQLGVVVLTNCLGAPSIEWMKGIWSILKASLKNNHKKISPLKRYAGVYTNDFTDIHITTLNNKLILYYLSSSRPCKNYDLLIPKGKDEFQFIGADGYSPTGEKATFTFGKKGKVKKLMIGPKQLDPLRKFTREY